MVAGRTSKVYHEQGGNGFVVEAADGGKILGQSASGGTPAQAAASVALTDNSGGSATDTIAVIGGTYDQAEVRDAVASLAAKLEDIRAAIRDAGILAQ